MVDHLQSRVTPWRQYASHVKVRGTLSKMDVKQIFSIKGLNANYLLQQHAKLFETSSDFNNFIQCLNSISKITKFFGHRHIIACSWTRIIKSTASTFSDILMNKYAVITTQKSSCVSFGQQRYVFAQIFPDISIKSRE